MLTNIKEFVKKYDTLCITLILTMILLGLGFMCKINSKYCNDEVLNFQNIYKMYNGYEIYKDVNVIITPLFFYIAEFLFKIFGANFFTFRIYNIIINVILYLLIYLLFKEILKSKQKSFLYTLIVLYSSFATVRLMANYNTLSVMFFMLGILLYIKENKNYILHGIVIFCIFMSKQNIGVLYIFGMLLNLILIEKLTKQTIIEFCKKISIFIFLFITYCIYLYFKENLYDFIAYCFLGISEFGSKNIKSDVDVIILIFLPLIVLLLRKFLNNKKIESKQIDIINSFAFPMLFISYPIFNRVHIDISIIGVIIELILILDLMIFKEFLNKYILEKIIYIILTCAILSSIYFFIEYIKCINEMQYEYKSYFGAIIEEETINNIENVTQYIKNNNKKIIVFGYKASLYNIALNTNNGAMDIPFFGNFGRDGEQGMLEQIQKLRNTNILIEKNEKDMIWQESKKIRKWIQENLKCVGEIENFLIYETE